jgi:hypothetical protein
MKIKTYRNGHTTFERLFPSGFYLIQLYIRGELQDKIRCDDYQSALDYLRSFNQIAKKA